MKTRHRIPVKQVGFKHTPENEIEPRYLNEVERSTKKLEQRHQRLQRDIAAAEVKRAKLAARTVKAADKQKRANELRDLDVLILSRRAELEELDQTMRSYVASAVHRGRGAGAIRPVPEMKLF